MPQVDRILESSLYVSDLKRAVAFYQDLFGLTPMAADERFCAFAVGGRQVLLLFERGMSSAPMPVAGGTIPAHDGSGELHVAFAIAASDLEGWEERLATKRIAIESRVTWPRGGRSIYFRDLDRNLVELVTPGIWPIY